MQIENHKEEVPFSYYEGLFSALRPEEALQRLPEVTWDGKEFYVNLLGRDYAISHPVYAIRALDGGNVPTLPTQTFLLRYLLESKSVSWQGDWKTFRELKSELKKVVWSTPQQVLKNALIVVACVLVVGVFIWLFDFVAQTLITSLINLFN